MQDGTLLTNLIPLGVSGLVVNVGRHIRDLFIVKTTPEGGHGVLAIGDLWKHAQSCVKRDGVNKDKKTG